jgi:hypothetical protein
MGHHLHLPHKIIAGSEKLLDNYHKGYNELSLRCPKYNNTAKVSVAITAAI